MYVEAVSHQFRMFSNNFSTLLIMLLLILSVRRVTCVATWRLPWMFTRDIFITSINTRWIFANIFHYCKRRTTSM